jgi:hypothetical protein
MVVFRKFFIIFFQNLFKFQNLFFFMVKFKYLKKPFTSKTRLSKYINQKIAEQYAKLQEDKAFIAEIDKELSGLKTKEDFHNYLLNAK